MNKLTSLPQVQFFAHLTVARVISVQSLYELLKSCTAVLDEFGVSHGRASKAGLCAAEGLMIVSAFGGILDGRLIIVQAGSIIKQDTSLDVVEILTALQTYIESTKDAKTLVQPVIRLFVDTAVLEHAEEVCVFLVRGPPFLPRSS